MSRRSVENDAPENSHRATKNALGLPDEVAAIVRQIQSFLDTKDANQRSIGSHKHGTYTFYDYDGEPIYVGQTKERVSGRIDRHLTNQRTDAVAMNVLDPFEVAEIEVWPLDERMTGLTAVEANLLLDRAEYTVFRKVLQESSIGAVLNEKQPIKCDLIDLPKSYRGTIIPDSIFSKRKHPDIRIARRATTIANLARVISERRVSKGLRRTLVTQAKRLESLATERAKELKIELR